MVALGIVLASVLFAPWQIVQKRAGHVVSVKTQYHFVASAPSTPEYGQESRLQLSPLFATWAALGIVYAGVFALLKRPLLTYEGKPQDN